MMTSRLQFRLKSLLACVTVWALLLALIAPALAPLLERFWKKPEPPVSPAVARALEWLRKHDDAESHWDLSKLRSEQGWVYSRRNNSEQVVEPDISFSQSPTADNLRYVTLP